ncbi:MAG: glycerophosphodiester phosphodiesterase [Candidatus Lokiarchaeota archaeon]
MNSTLKIPLIIAHRGSSDIAPENTLQAFQMAIELEADYIEFDVRCSADGELVIIHDNCTLRTTKKLKWINRMNLEEIKSLDAGENELIPTLNELIKYTKGKINYMCEIKVRGIIDNVVKLLAENNLLDSTILISFKHDELLHIQNQYPHLKFGAIVPTAFGWLTNWFVKKQTITTAKHNQFYAINPYYRIINRNYVRLVHNKYLKVFPWTVNSQKSINRVIKLGVDGILTNHIKKMKVILGS